MAPRLVLVKRDFLRDWSGSLQAPAIDTQKRSIMTRARQRCNPNTLYHCLRTRAALTYVCWAGALELQRIQLYAGSWGNIPLEPPIEGLRTEPLCSHASASVVCETTLDIEPWKLRVTDCIGLSPFATGCFASVCSESFGFDSPCAACGGDILEPISNVCVFVGTAKDQAKACVFL